MPSASPIDEEPTSILGGSSSGAVQSTTSQSDSKVARVDIEHFDPTGVQELRRTLTKKSANDVQQEKSSTSYASSDITLTGLTLGEGPFDFEKTLRHLVRK